MRSDLAMKKSDEAFIDYHYCELENRVEDCLAAIAAGGIPDMGEGGEIAAFSERGKICHIISA